MHHIQHPFQYQHRFREVEFEDHLIGKIDPKAFGWQLRNEGAFGVQRHPFQQYLR